MELFFLLGAAQAFFFSFLLIGKGNKDLHYRLLFFFFLIIGLLLISQFLSERGMIFKYPHLIGLTYTLPIIFGPILYFYTRVLIEGSDRHFRFEFLLHSIPFLFLTIYFLCSFYFLGPEEKLQYYERQTEGDTQAIIYISEFFVNLSLPVYSMISLILLRKHLRNLKTNLSNIENLDLHWLRVVLISMVSISFISILLGIISDFWNFISFELSDNILYTFLTCITFFLGYYGIRQKPVLVKTDTNIQAGAGGKSMAKYAKSSLKEHEKNDLVIQLDAMMKIEKPYLLDKLSLSDLANRLGVTQNHISQIINEHYHQNFFEFINRHRVNEVIDKLSDPKFAHYSILGIAFECGFGSKSSFNSVFKQVTGKTPSEYKRSVQ